MGGGGGGGGVGDVDPSFELVGREDGDADKGVVVCFAVLLWLKLSSPNAKSYQTTVLSRNDFTLSTFPTIVVSFRRTGCTYRCKIMQQKPQSHHCTYHRKIQPLDPTPHTPPAGGTASLSPSPAYQYFSKPCSVPLKPQFHQRRRSGESASQTSPDRSHRSSWLSRNIHSGLDMLIPSLIPYLRRRCRGMVRPPLAHGYTLMMRKSGVDRARSLVPDREVLKAKDPALRSDLSKMRHL